MGNIGRDAKDALPMLEGALKDRDEDARKAAELAIQKIKN